jgi:hypothetical protein
MLYRLSLCKIISVRQTALEIDLHENVIVVKLCFLYLNLSAGSGNIILLIIQSCVHSTVSKSLEIVEIGGNRLKVQAFANF